MSKSNRKRNQLRGSSNIGERKIINGEYLIDDTTCNVLVIRTGYSSSVVCGQPAQHGECEFHYYLRIDSEARSQCRSHKTKRIIAGKEVEYDALIQKLGEAAIRQHARRTTDTYTMISTHR
jgi:hypothetical protein